MCSHRLPNSCSLHSLIRTCEVCKKQEIGQFVLSFVPAPVHLTVEAIQKIANDYLQTSPYSVKSCAIRDHKDCADATSRTSNAQRVHGVHSALGCGIHNLNLKGYDKQTILLEADIAKMRVSVI